MGESTAIAWCDHTLNPWIGCLAVSAACDRCYARTFVNGRMGRNFDERHRTAASTWAQPRAWNRKALREGRRARVFCASLADVFDNRVPAEWRADLWALIRETPALDWLLLTKRPQNIRKMLPADWGTGYPNVWLGTTCENQTEAWRRVPVLLDVPAAVHFLSCEPLLEPLDLRHLSLGPPHDVMLDALTGYHSTAEMRRQMPHPDGRLMWSEGDPVPAPRAAVDWVIVGGESGAGARLYYPEWARDLLRQCREAGVAYFHKQVGSRRDGWEGITGKGDNPAEWPADLRVQDFPASPVLAVAA